MLSADIGRINSSVIVGNITVEEPIVVNFFFVLIILIIILFVVIIFILFIVGRRRRRILSRLSYDVLPDVNAIRILQPGVLQGLLCCESLCRNV